MADRCHGLVLVEETTVQSPAPSRCHEPSRVLRRGTHAVGAACAGVKRARRSIARRQPSACRHLQSAIARKHEHGVRSPRPWPAECRVRAPSRPRPSGANRRCARRSWLQGGRRRDSPVVGLIGGRVVWGLGRRYGVPVGAGAVDAQALLPDRAGACAVGLRMLALAVSCSPDEGASMLPLSRSRISRGCLRWSSRRRRTSGTRS